MCVSSLCLRGAEGRWIIESVDVQPQSVALGWLWWSLAEQTENSRSVLAGWLPLCDATSSLAGTDRCVTSLIRTQLHRHIKGFPFYTRSRITILGIFQHLLHPQTLTSPSLGARGGRARVLGHFQISAAESRRRRWLIQNYDNDLEDGERADEASYYLPRSGEDVSELCCSLTLERDRHWLFYFVKSADTQMFHLCFFSGPTPLSVFFLLVRALMLGCKYLREERVTSFPPDLSWTHTYTRAPPPLFFITLIGALGGRHSQTLHPPQSSSPVCFFITPFCFLVSVTFSSLSRLLLLLSVGWFELSLTCHLTVLCGFRCGC